MQFYSINVRSDKLNIVKRCLDEAELTGTRTTDLKLAQQKARAFADRFNKAKTNGATDWRPLVEVIDSPFVKKT
jgi:hypothetical protein